MHGSDGYVEHLYDAKEMEDKINFRYRVCGQDNGTDGIIQISFKNNEFSAQLIEYDDHQENGNYFSEISNVKNSLFQYFDSHSDINELTIYGGGYPYLSLQKNGYGGVDDDPKGNTIPVQLVNELDLYHLDIDQELYLTKQYGLGKDDAIVRGHYRWSYKDYDLLLYTVTIGEETAEVSASDTRLLVIDHDGVIQKNIFIGGSATEEGESLVERKIRPQANGIELIIENEPNYMSNIPKHLKLKAVEFIKL